jgi:hypothetical protein
MPTFWIRHARALTRASIILSKSFYEDGWIASQLGLARVAYYYLPQVG